MTAVNWPARNRRLFAWLKRGIAVTILVLAAALLYRTLRNYSFDEIAGSVRAIPLERILLGGVFAAGSYFCLSWFDFMGVRYAGKTLPYPKVALASFCALSLGHNIGFAALSSGAIRYRFYARWGLTPGEVAKVIIFCGVTVGLGMLTLGGIALLVRPDLAATMLRITPTLAQAAGTLCLSLPALYLLGCAFLRSQVRIRNWRLPMPPLKYGVAQIAVGSSNYACVAGALHQVLSAAGDVPYLPVAATYVIANTSALITHAPGGIGVVESVVMFLLPGSGVIGALVMFRVLYYLVPLAIGAPLFGLTELYYRQKKQAP